MFGAILVVGLAATSQLDLLSRPDAWHANVDSGGTKIALERTDAAPLSARIVADGGKEDFPKLRLSWSEPQDWRRFRRLKARLRVTCDDPNVKSKRMCFVFYDERTRLENYPGRPMRQQIIHHTCQAGKWTDINDIIAVIKRSAIRQLDVYVYECPPGSPHGYRWEIAELKLEGTGEDYSLLDGEPFRKETMAGSKGQPAARIRTNDGLELTLGDNGSARAVSVDRRILGEPEGQPTGLLVRDVTTDEPPVMVGGEITQHGDDAYQTARLDKLGLAVETVYRNKGDYVEVRGSVEDLSGRDRAVSVYLALPLRGVAWRWWDSISSSRTEADEGYELGNWEPGSGYGLNGMRSKYPLSALSHPKLGGLSLAIRMDEPVVHRIAFNPEQRLLYVAFDFGLVPEKTIHGRPLSKADFRFMLYRHDPGWGFRSALQRYYDFFPEFFTKRTTTEGGWFVWGDMSKTESVLDGGFGFHWGPGGPDAVKWDNANGLLALNYIEPEFYQETLGDFEAPTQEDALGRLKRLAEGDAGETEEMQKLSYARGGAGHMGYGMKAFLARRTLPDFLKTISRATMASVSYSVSGQPYCGLGKYPWMGETQQGAILHCNLDPEIPDGKGRFNIDVALKCAFEYYESQGARLDGVALDSFGGYGQAHRANYRREHFRYADFPLTFSAAERVPVLATAFSSVEWLRELAQQTHAKGQVLMANCSWGSTPAWLTFAAPYLDVFGAESVQFADPDYIRAIAYRKPCTDLPYKPRPDAEVAWHLLHDIYPGHGNKIEVLNRFASLLRELSNAGWEPITHARAEPNHLRIERYGRGDAFYLVLHNPRPEPVKATVRIDLRALGIDACACALHPSGQALEMVNGAAALDLGGQATLILRLRAE